MKPLITIVSVGVQLRSDPGVETNKELKCKKNFNDLIKKQNKD